MAPKIANQVQFNIPPKNGHKAEGHAFEELHRSSLLFPNLIPETERAFILKTLDEKASWLPVSVAGMSGEHTPDDGIGSYHASSYIPDYAKVLWKRVKPYLPDIRVFSDDDPTDWDNHALWKPVGVSNLLRFVKYEQGGEMVAHYDAPYIENDSSRTLSTLVIYLDREENLKGGSTRYLHDKQESTPVSKRNLKDWSRTATGEEVRYKLNPQAGSAVIFDHRLLHDVEKVVEGHKTILHANILYEKI